MCLPALKKAGRHMQIVHVHSPAVARVRLNHFGKGILDPSEVEKLAPKSILDFLKAIDLKEI